MNDRAVKMLMLPSRDNRSLINALARSYISEDFQHLSNSTALWLRNTLAQENVAFSQCLFRTINAIILDNVYYYVVENETYHFATTLGYEQFAHNLRIRVKYLNDLFSNWAIVPVDDIEEAESAITRFVLEWFVKTHRDYRHEIDSALMDLYESMRLYTPYRYVGTYRYEIGPDLSPLLLYSDCIDQVTHVHGVAA